LADVFCNQCGHRNPAGSNFCSSCGAPLDPSRDDRTITFHPADPATDTPAEDVEVEVGDVPPGLGLLVGGRGADAPLRFALSAGTTRVGRHPDSDIFLDDITVSRRHAEIDRRGDGYVLRDVGSLNGTYLNRERIDEAPLRNGDEVQIGKFKLVFLAGNTGPSEP